MLLIMFSSTVFGQADTYRKGVVIDSIQVGDSSETYTLYLPKSFDQNILSAIVFIFDPGGKGWSGIQPFKSSAEKYNYILICSNNSKNGPYSTNFEVINRLFDSVFSTFNIDEKQIYVAGFSGGSRLATAIAVLTDQIQGVIACGAGFSPESSHMPLSKKSFSYVGLVGERDMNYYEMFEVGNWLNRFQIENEIFTYDDDHRWPPEKQINKAFDWLELQAYKRNIRVRNNEITSKTYRMMEDRAKAFQSERRYLRSSWEYERILRNFESIYTLDSIQDKLIDIKNKAEYNFELSQFKELEAEEKKIKMVYSERFNKDLNAKRITSKYKWWEKKLSNLNDELELSKNPDRAKMLKRIRYAIYAMVIETSYNMLRLKHVEKALYCHHLVALMVPDRSFIYYNLSRDYAMLNDQDHCIDYLKLAISKGYSNKETILNTPAFQKYMETDEMKELLRGL